MLNQSSNVVFFFRSKIYFVFILIGGINSSIFAQNASNYALSQSVLSSLPIAIQQPENIEISVNLKNKTAAMSINKDGYIVIEKMNNIEELWVQNNDGKDVIVNRCKKPSKIDMRSLPVGSYTLRLRTENNLVFRYSIEKE